MEYVGKFVPPAMGHTSKPIAIAGDGTLSVSDRSIVASGFKAGGFNALVVVATAAAAMVGAIAVKLTIMPGMSATIIGGVIAGGLVTGASVGRKPKNEPYQIEIPFENIKTIAKDAYNPASLKIVVKKFKPKGSIHFAPGDDLDGVIAALQARILG